MGLCCAEQFVNFAELDPLARAPSQPVQQDQKGVLNTSARATERWDNQEAQALSKLSRS